MIISLGWAVVHIMKERVAVPKETNKPVLATRVKVVKRPRDRCSPVRLSAILGHHTRRPALRG